MDAYTQTHWDRLLLMQSKVYTLCHCDKPPCKVQSHFLNYGCSPNMSAWNINKADSKDVHKASHRHASQSFWWVSLELLSRHCFKSKPMRKKASQKFSVMNCFAKIPLTPELFHISDLKPQCILFKFCVLNQHKVLSNCKMEGNLCLVFN